MHVVPVPLGLTHGLSTLRITLPEDLRPPENRRATLLTVKVL
jgi:ATP-dependent RNA helicase DOB1